MKLLYAMVASLLLLSCSDSGNSEKYSLTYETLCGTWVIKMIDGEELPTNEYFVCRYNVDGGEDYFCIVSDGESTSNLVYTDDTTFSVANGKIYMYSDIVDLEFEGAIASATLCGDAGDILTYTELINIQESEDLCSGRTFTAIRSTSDYTSQIIGTWEGSVIAGDESEPFDSIKVEFKTDGSFDFYKPEGEDWTRLDENNIYRVEGNLLGTQWSESQTVTQAEMWIVEIDGDNMTWRAERDGVDGEAGFDFERVTDFTL